MMMMMMPDLWNEDMDMCGTVRKTDPALYKKNGGPGPIHPRVLES